jgi:two-component system CheB/CheR fusion protein
LDVQELEIDINLEIRITELAVYPILFKRLLTNLISNAIKYRSENKLKIEISCYDSDDKATFTIKDNGIGIPSDQFTNIFKIFKTINANKDSNGIGLSVCKKIIELHRGEIWIESQLGEGTSINFTLAKN